MLGVFVPEVIGDTLELFKQELTIAAPASTLGQHYLGKRSLQTISDNHDHSALVVQNNLTIIQILSKFYLKISYVGIGLMISVLFSIHVLMALGSN